MNTDNVLNRAYANWLRDGIFEIGIGVLFTVIGAIRAIIHFAGEKTPAYYWLTVGLFLFMFAFSFGFSRITKSLKSRITYQRTGYVNFKSKTFNYKRFFAVLIPACIFGGMLGYFSTQPNERQIGIFVPITMGMIGAAALIYAAQRLELKRFYILAVVSIGIGVVLGALRVGVVLGVSFYYLDIGLALVVSGSAGLVKYLRLHQPVELNGEGQ